MIKSTKMLIIIISSVLAVALIAALVIFGISKSKTSENTTGNTSEGNQTSNTAQNTNTSTNKTQTTEIVDTAVTGLKGKTLDYYWNIDTTKFDPTKFNGDISFFGKTVNGKITTRKLKDAGVDVNVETYYSSGKYRTELEAEVKTKYYSSGTPIFSIDVDSTDLCIYNRTDSTICSDNTLVSINRSFTWNLRKINILPAQLGVSSPDEVTIDLVLEKLGNPTYVEKRKSKNLETLSSYTTYIYVYDDVVFLFAFYNWQNLNLAASFYYPIEEFTESTRPATLKSDYELYLKSEKR